MQKLGDPKFEEAAILVVLLGQASASIIQRKLSIGFARSNKIVDLLEYARIIGPFNGSKDREILVKDMDSLSSILQGLPDENPFEAVEKIDYAELEKQQVANTIKEKYRKKELENQVLQELQESGEIDIPSSNYRQKIEKHSDKNLLELVQSQQRTIEMQAETIRNLTTHK